MRYGTRNLGRSGIGPWARRLWLNATFTWTLQGVSPTTIGALATDELEFAGAGGFGSKVTVGAWQDTTHVRTLPSTDKSTGNTPENNKFISQTGGGAGDSEADWGDGTEDIDAILTSECALLINFAHGSSVITENAIFFGYQQGASTTTVPLDVNVKAAEQGDIIFTDAEGSAAALGLTDQGTSTSHDFFIILSCSPSAVGLKDSVGELAFRIELDYS
jgi:hypothetical protein